MDIAISISVWLLRSVFFPTAEVSCGRKPLIAVGYADIANSNNFLSLRSLARYIVKAVNIVVSRALLWKAMGIITEEHIDTDD